MLYRRIGIAVGALILAVVGFVNGAGADQPEQQAARPTGFIENFATAIWLSDDGLGNHTGFYFFVTENFGRSDYPGENVEFHFTSTDQAAGTTTYMAGVSNSSNGQFFASAGSATLRASMPVVRCVFGRDDFIQFGPGPGPLPDNCITRTIELDLDMTPDGPQDQTHDSSHSNSPDCRITGNFNSHTVPILATGSIIDGQTELTGGMPGSGLLAHDVSSIIKVGPCPDTD